MRLVTVTLVANKCFIFVRQLKLFARKRNPDFPLESMRLMKLADKYHLDVVKNEIVSRLSADWPKDLEEWDLADVCSEFYADEGRSILRNDWPEDLVPEPISAAILAIEGKITGVLTAVFYDMYRAYRNCDWDEVISEPSSYLRKGARWSLAAKEQLHKLALIQVVVDRNLYMRVPLMFFDMAGVCETPDECKPLLKDKRDEVTVKLWQSRDPLAVFRRLRQWSADYISCELCGGCRDVLFVESKRTRDAIWSQITELVESS